jgi:hypothetical protein
MKKKNPQSLRTNFPTNAENSTRHTTTKGAQKSRQGNFRWQESFVMSSGTLAPTHTSTAATLTCASPYY